VPKVGHLPEVKGIVVRSSETTAFFETA